MKKIITLTCMCTDTFDGTDEIRPGGESLNFAVHASREADVRTAIMGAVGKDVYGDRIRSVLEKTSVDASHVYQLQGQTANNVTYLTPEGDRYYKADSWTGGVYESFVLSKQDKAVLADADLLHTSIHCPNFRDILEVRKRNRLILAVDYDNLRDFKEWEKDLPWIDLFFISGDAYVAELLTEYSRRYPKTIFVITLAADGSVAVKEGSAVHCPACRPKQIVETTGCGDSYQAGFICEYLRSGDLMSAMQHGSEVAASVLEHVGGFSLIF